MLKSLFSIWLYPKKTMRAALERDSKTEFLIFSVLLGVALLLLSAVDDRWGETLSTGWMILIILAGGSLFGMFWVYLMGALLHWTGKRLKGEASQHEIRAAIAFGGIPIIWSGVLTLVIIIVFKGVNYTTTPSELGVIPSAAVIIIALLTPLWMFLFIVLPFMISAKCLAVVRGTSAWSALLNYVLAYAVMVAAGFVIAIVTVLLTEFGP